MISTASIGNVNRAAAVKKSVNSDPYWNNVVLLLTGDDFLDHSKTPKTITKYGDTKIDTVTKKSGTGSMYFDGNGDYLTFSATKDVSFGIDDFTIESWLNPTSLEASLSSQNLFLALGSGSVSASLITEAVQMAQSWVASLVVSSSSDIKINNWFHVVISRASSVTKVYVNGVMLSSFSDTTNYSSTQVSVIGKNDNGDNNPSLFYSGYIDSLRITKGVARYTANFTPPDSFQIG